MPLPRLSGAVRDLGITCIGVSFIREAILCELLLPWASVFLVRRGSPASLCRSETEPGTLRQYELAFFNSDPAPRIIGHKQVSVEVGVINQGRNVCGRGDGAGTGNHAAEHDLHAHG